MRNVRKEGKGINVTSRSRGELTRRKMYQEEKREGEL